MPGPAAAVDLLAFETLLEPLGAWFEQYGDVTRFTTEDGEGYSLCSPELASLVLREHARSFVRGWGVERVRLVLPGGLLVDEGAAWKRHRALARPLFHHQWLEALPTRAHHYAKRTRDAWVQASHRGETIDVTTDTSLLALRCVLDALFGADAAEHSPLLALAHEHRRDLAFARRFRAYRPWVRELVAGRAAQGSFLHSLVHAEAVDGAPFSTEELVDQVLTFVIAGHETTASTLTWVWIMLARHPAAASRLHHELDLARTQGASDEDCCRLPYLRAVVDETLRLYPPVWLLTRRAIANVRLGDFDIAPGSQVFVPLSFVLRHPRHWSDPNTFEPERFFDLSSRHPLAFAPFGVGPRRCVGEQLARLDIRCLVAQVASVLELSLDAEVGVDAQVNLRPRGVVRMTPHLRRAAALDAH